MATSRSPPSLMESVRVIVSDVGSTVNANLTSSSNDTGDSFNGVHSPLWSLEYFILAVMIAMFALAGIVGNIPVLIVYFRRKENMASNTFIKILAFVDLIVCSLVMPYTIVYELHILTSDVTCRSFEFIRHFTISASNLTLAAIAVERYIAVCQISRKMSVNSINCGVWIIILVSCVIAAPAVGTFAVVNESEVRDLKCPYPHEATGGRFCHFTHTVMGETLVTIYQGVLMVIFVASFLAIVVLYTIVYAVLWKKTKIKRMMVSKDALTGMEIRLSLANTALLTEGNGRAGDLVKATNGHARSQSQCSGQPEDSSDLQDEISSSSDAKRHSQAHVKFDPNNKHQQCKQNGTKANGARTHRGNRKSKFSTLSVRSEKERRKRHYHRRTAKMLFLCSIIYVTTWLPFWFDIFGLTNSLILRYLFFLGNVVNPIVYGIVNEQVRRAFKRLFFECVRRWCGFRRAEVEGEDTINTSDIRSR